MRDGARRRRYENALENLEASSTLSGGKASDHSSKTKKANLLEA